MVDKHDTPVQGLETCKPILDKRHHFPTIKTARVFWTDNHVRTGEFTFGVSAADLDADYSCIGNGRVEQKRVFELGGRDLPAADFDEFLDDEFLSKTVFPSSRLMVGVV